MSTPDYTTWTDERLKNYQRHYEHAAASSDTPSTKKFYDERAGLVAEERNRRAYLRGVPTVDEHGIGHYNPDVVNNKFVYINLPEGSKGERLGDYMQWTPAEGVYIARDGGWALKPVGEQQLPLSAGVIVRDHNLLRGNHANQAATIGEYIAKDQERVTEINGLKADLRAEKASHALTLRSLESSREGYRLQYKALGDYQRDEKKMLAEIERLNSTVTQRTLLSWVEDVHAGRRTIGPQLKKYLDGYQGTTRQEIYYSQHDYALLQEELKGWPELHVTGRINGQAYSVRLEIDLSKVVPVIA